MDHKCIKHPDPRTVNSLQRGNIPLPPPLQRMSTKQDDQEEKNNKEEEEERRYVISSILAVVSTINRLLTLGQGIKNLYPLAFTIKDFLDEHGPDEQQLIESCRPLARQLYQKVLVPDPTASGISVRHRQKWICMCREQGVHIKSKKSLGNEHLRGLRDHRLIYRETKGKGVKRQLIKGVWQQKGQGCEVMLITRAHAHIAIAFCLEYGHIKEAITLLSYFSGVSESKCKAFLKDVWYDHKGRRPRKKALNGSLSGPSLSSSHLRSNQKEGSSRKVLNFFSIALQEDVSGRQLLNWPEKEVRRVLKEAHRRHRKKDWEVEDAVRAWQKGEIPTLGTKKNGVGHCIAHAKLMKKFGCDAYCYPDFEPRIRFRSCLHLPALLKAAANLINQFFREGLGAPKDRWQWDDSLNRISRLHPQSGACQDHFGYDKLSIDAFVHVILESLKSRVPQMLEWIGHVELPHGIQSQARALIIERGTQWRPASDI